MFGGCGECKPAPRQPKPRKHPCLFTEPAVDAVNPPTEVDKRWDAVADFRAEAAVAAGRGKRLAAVAKPVSEHGFDGRIGFYPVAMRVTAKRDGKLRKKGGEFWKSVNMDAALFKEFLKHKIVPDALRATGSWARKIIIQMDNAGGHGGGKGDISKTTLAELNSWATNLPDDLLKLCPQGPPVFEFVAQPPRSPDLNVLDLGVWTSLQVAVDKLKHDKGNDTPTVSELFDCCIDAWSKWPADKVLDKIFKTLVNVLSFIEEEKGGNDYTLPHQNQVNKFS